MPIPFAELYEDYRTFLRGEIATSSYRKQVAHDSFCFVSILKPSSFLISCWDDFGMDDLYLDLLDYLQKDGEEEADKKARNFRTAINFFSKFLHSRYESYRNLPPIEIPDSIDEFEQQHEFIAIDYAVVFQRVLEREPGYAALIQMAKDAPKASVNEWRLLVEKVQRTDEGAFNRLLEIYTNRILKDALQFSDKYHADLGECIQNALYGFFIAVTKYPLDGDQPFPAYYQLWLQNYMMRFASVGNTIFRYPAHLTEKLCEIITRINDRCPEFFEDYLIDQELLEKVVESGESITDVERMIELLVPFCSIDDMNENDDLDEEKDNTNEQTAHCQIMEYEEDPFEVYVKNDLSQRIRALLEELKPREKKVLQMRYGVGYDKEMTLEEVGYEFNVTRERIRQIEAKAIRKLRTPSRSKKIKDFL